MTKQEAIQKAYGEHWETVKDYVDENGFVDILLYPTEKISAEFKEYYPEYLKKSSLCRPLSLQGIETNNGWIKIESEADFPKEHGYYSIIWLDAKNTVRNEIYKVDEKGINCPPSACVTHYQPIKKPKPPIY